MNGKGSKPRPIKNIKKYGANWDSINWSKNTDGIQPRKTIKMVRKSPPEPMTVDISDELYIDTVCDYFDLTEKYFRFNKHGEVYEFNFEKHSKMFNELCGLDTIFEYVIEDSKYRFTILNKDLWLWAKIKYGF